MNEHDFNNPNYTEAYRQAAKRVQAKVGFYWHFSSYVVVNAFLILVFLLTGPIPGFYNYPWFVWVMAGWGVGLMFHYFGVFVNGRPSQINFRQQMIEEELRRMGVTPPGEPPPQ